MAAVRGNPAGQHSELKINRSMVVAEVAKIIIHTF
jgi:hypothetical protein